MIRTVETDLRGAGDKKLSFFGKKLQFLKIISKLAHSTDQKLLRGFESAH